MLPFTREQFFGIFADYNTAVWPMQLVAYALGLAVVAALLRPSPPAHRFVASALAAMWIWTGVAYHGLFFARINPVALAFGALLLTSVPVPRWLLIIPLAWSLVGGSAAFMLGVPQDWPLLFSGLTIVLLILRDRRRAG